jgi:hypothetical protein
MAADWTTIRTEYIHGSLTMRELADKHGIKAAGLMRRAAKEGWDAQRKQQSAEISKAAGEVLTESRAAQLARFNEEDIRLSCLGKAKAESMLHAAASPNDVRACMSAIDIAQKVGRLALGASTENADVTVHNDDDDALAAALADRLERSQPGATRH